jgi:methionyl-tRNA synthetase
VEKKKFYITTAIAYLNGKPHMGHALEIIQADCVARFHRLLGKEVVFQTGSDEHGAKNFKTAAEKNVEIMPFIDKNYESFINLYKSLNISFDRYCRTTNPVHKKGAQKLWIEMFKQNDIYKSNYNGLYCVGCEVYKTTTELENGVCPNHPNREIMELKEENYFFKLTNYKEKLLELYNSDTIQIIPKKWKAEILGFINSGLMDVSFSRQKEKMSWGIQVPNDDGHVMYVWCDALSNYITNVGYEYDQSEFNSIWPADIHLIGKDITRFHAVYWPAMLLSAKLPLPKKLFVHGFLTIEGSKIGKSLGNAIDPVNVIKEYGCDPFRFYLLKNVPSSDDGSFKEDDLITVYNNSLANDLGNLVLRVITFVEKDFQNQIPKLYDISKEDQEMIDKFDFVKDIEQLFANFQLNLASERIWEFIKDVNKFVNDTAPWVLRKSDNKERYSTVIYILIEALRVISIYIQPFIPSISEKVAKIIGITANQNFSDVKFKTDTTGTIGKRQVLFPKKEAIKKQDPNAIFNFKVGKVLEINEHPTLDEIYVLKIDLKETIITVCAKIAKYYSMDEVKTLSLVVLTNLKHREIGGIMSKGMLLGGMDPQNQKLQLATAEGNAGEQIYIGDLEPEKEAMVSGKKLSKTKIKVKDNKVKIANIFLKTKEKFVQVNLKDGIRLR